MITVRQSTAADVEAISSLLSEVDRFYGGAEDEPMAERLELIRDALFGDSPGARAILACDGDRLVGLASYSFLWPAAGASQSLFLKELFVTESTRRRGVGQALIQELCRIAQKGNCSRVEWTTDSDNPMSQQFYAKLNVAPDTSKVFYRISGDALTRLANSANAPDSD